MLKEKSDEKQILSNNEDKALINNLIDQIEFLTLIRLGFLRVVFLGGVSYFKKNLSNINITSYNC